MKANISLDDELMGRIDEYAAANFMTRSGFISFACNQYLNELAVSKALSDMALSMRKIADSGKVDAQTMQELKQFEKIVEMISA